MRTVLLRWAQALLFVVALLGGTTPGVASGGDGSNTSSGGTGASSSSFATTTKLTLTGVAYFHPGKPSSRLDARLLLKPDWALARWGELSAVVVARLDSDREIARDLSPDWRETALRGRALEVRELTFTAHLPAVDLTLGKQAIAWGIGDALQPTDSLTPRDLTDPLNDRRLGAWGASADLYLGETEAVVSLLRHSPDRLPLAGYRWFPVAGLGGVPIQRQLPTGRDAWIGALQLRGYARYFDWSLVARRGPDLAPHLAAETPQGVTLAYPQMSLVGGWVSVPAGSVVLRGELAWRRYDRQPGVLQPEDFATALVGVEHRFAGLVWGKDATWITEAVADEHTGGARLPREIAILDPVRLFRTGLFSKLLVHNPTGWEAEVGGGVDLAEGGGIAQLLARYNASDRVRIEAGVDLLFAGGNRALEPIAGNDRLVLRTIIRP